MARPGEIVEVPPEMAGINIPNQLEFPPIPTLKEKLSKVAQHCAYVRKDGVNLFHKYNYATAATIFEKVNEALAEHRLVSMPGFDVSSDVMRQNAKGGTEQLVTVKCTLVVEDLDSDKYAKATAYGSGQDNGDKAVMKAQTAALKYAWMMLLNISTGDDPEDDAKVDSRMSGEPIRAKKTPEEYAATVQANKDANYSPEAVRLSNEINQALGRDPLPDWPGEAPKSSQTHCGCGARLIQKTTSKAKGSKPYWTCELSDLAFRKDPEAVAEMVRLEEQGFGGKEHTWRWAT